VHDELTKLIVVFLKAAGYIDVKLEDHAWDAARRPVGGAGAAGSRPEPSPTPAAGHRVPAPTQRARLRA